MPKKIPARKISHPSLFDDPQSARVLWHDVKKSGARVWLGVESISEGLYGKVTAELDEAVQEMRAQTQEMMISLDAVALLSKIRFGLPQGTPELVTAESVDHAINSMKPLARKEGIFLNPVVATCPLYLDPTYCDMFIQNSLLTLLRAAAPKTTINITIEQDKKQRPQLRCVLKKRKKVFETIPKSLTSLAAIYTSALDEWHPLRLPAALSACIARHNEMSAVITLTKEGIEFIFTLRGKYEQSKKSRSKDRTLS
jgi:hypothetical protein